MEKNDQHSGILDPASADIEMEKNDQLSGILDPAPAAVVSTDYDRRPTRTYKEPRASKVGLLKTKNNGSASPSTDTKIEIKQLEKLLGAEYKLKDIRVPVSQFSEYKLEDIRVPVPQFCIYKVPKYLRKINEKAYTPQVISIGPLHHGDKALVEMEKQKLIYILEFQKREGAAEKLKEFKKIIEDKVQLIRDCYQENSRLSNPEFVNMILLDAVFIIQFFLKNEEQESDFFLDTTCVKTAITRDLQLLENQLPYFLLKELFEKVSQLFVEGDFRDLTEKQKKKYPARDPDPFLILCYQFFFNSEIAVLPEPNDQIQHFTDLRRYFLLMDFLPRDQKQGEPRDQKQGEHVSDLPAATKLEHVSDLPTATKKHVRDLPTATKLHGSGVKFKKQEIEGGNSLKISCERIPMRIPCFKGCKIPIPYIKDLTLQIPRFEIDDQSECLYRNMMALELCHYPNETHICNFILLMDFLINTGKDVDLLVERGIIFSRLGNNATIAKMFHNLSLQITPSPSVYHDIGEKLKAHYAIPWNRTMATLNPVYFRIAVIGLVLTFIQAVCSVLSLWI